MEECLLLLKNSLQFLARNYHRYRFYKERDIVCIIQNNLLKQILQNNLPYKIFNDYPIRRIGKRSLATDIAILDVNDKIISAVEFKYEPSHERTDIPKNKFPVVVWNKNGVGDDVKRIHRFVKEFKIPNAIAIFIDEDGGYRKRNEPHQGCEWIDWANNVSVHCTHPRVASFLPT